METWYTLTPTERKYHIIEKEMLAVKYGCKKFRVYILGRPTVVLTDHKPLLGVMRKPEHDNRRLMAYKNDISEFTLRPEHVPGKENKSDFWTRLGLGPESDSKVCVVGEYGAYPNPERDSRVCLLRSMDVRMRMGRIRELTCVSWRTSGLQLYELVQWVRRFSFVVPGGCSCLGRGAGLSAGYYTESDIRAWPICWMLLLATIGRAKNRMFEILLLPVPVRSQKRAGLQGTRRSNLLQRMRPWSW